MPDRLFYPLFILLIAGMITAALLPGPDRSNTLALNQDSANGPMLARGADLRALRAAEGLSVDLHESEDGDEVEYARARATRAEGVGDGSAGVFITIAPRQERALNGRTVRVAVLARARGADATDRFLVGYFTGDSPGSSGWREFTPTREFETYVFTFALPEKDGPPGVDYLGVWPDPSGEGKTLDIAQLSVEPVE
ncbi:hypothetical protein [Euryhalocaulis caribicus]|uniref:hypothetical protein n=1 Tax=Euryhalocaulis caribicus TaxID=1161401 RepID=UPI00039FBFDB|nr:hypothetical protein [Euryhalocaulis caribicus]